MSTKKLLKHSVKAALFMLLTLSFNFAFGQQARVYSDAGLTTLVSTHTTIQGAIDDATTLPGYFIVVDAGTYAENITVSKSLDIRGPNYNISPNTGTRVAEALIVPSATNIASGVVVSLTSANVSFNGFTVNGDNEALTASGSGINGSVDALHAIFSNINGIVNTQITNNIVKNVMGSGIRLQSLTNYFATTAGVVYSYNNIINNNLIENISSLGIDLRNSVFTKITNNTITNARYGIYVNSFRVKDQGNEADRVISGNTVQATQWGIWANLYSATPYAVSNNSISAYADASRTTWYGVMMSTVSCIQNSTSQLNLPQAVTPEKWTFTNNTINGSSLDANTYGYGYWMWNVDNNNDGNGNAHYNTISGGSVSNVGTGIYMNNMDTQPNTNFGTARPGTHLTIEGVSISVNSGGKGIELTDDAAWATANIAPLTAKRDVKLSIGAGVSISGGQDGMVISHPVDGTVTYTAYNSITSGDLNDISFSGQSGDYISLTNHPNSLDATAASFNNKTGATATLVENFTIEDKIQHALDNSAYGFVRVKAAEVFVTSNSGSVQRGIDAATASDIVNVNAGTYAENVTVNKALTIEGPQKDVDPRTAAALRTPGSAAEAIVNGSGNAIPIFDITAAGVVLNGLEITNGTGDLISSPGGAPVKTGVVVKYCIVSNAGDEGIQLRNVNGGGVEYCYVFSTTGDGINLTGESTNSYIQYNQITTSASNDAAIYLYANGPNMLVDNNLISGITSVNGIMIGNKNGSEFNKNSAFTNNAVVSNNTVTGHAGSEVGIYINTSRVNVINNNITNWASATDAALYFRYNIKEIQATENIISGNQNGIKISSGVSATNAGTFLINENNLTGNTDKAINNGSSGAVNATCNWYGTEDAAIIANSVSGSVNFLPFLVEDVDGSISPSWSTDTYSCTGGPVRVYSDAAETNLISVHLTIQAAINAATTLSGYVVLVDEGTYNEQVLVNKAVTIKGVGATRPIVDFTGTVTGKPTLFDVSVDGVTIENIHFNVNMATIRSAIIASGAGIDFIAIKDNLINAYGTPAGSYGDRNAVSVNYSGPINYKTATNGVNSVIFTGNTVNVGSAGAFRSGISADEVGLTATGNTLTTINHDILLRFASNGANLISNNTFSGGGLELSDQNAGSGLITVTNNTFTGAGAPGAAVLRVKNNNFGVAHLISSNTFTNFNWAISLENMNLVTLDSNTFTGGTATDRHVVVNTKSISSNSNTIVQVPVAATMTNNIFNGLGIALTFQNHDNDNASYGTFTIGTSGNENNFASTLASFITLDNQVGSTNGSTFPVYPSTGGWPTTMACWDQDLDIANNLFDIGAGLQLPSAMSAGDRATLLEQQLFHKPDDACLASLDYYFPVNVYSDAAQTNFIKKHTSIQSAINAATTLPGYFIVADAGTYAENVTINGKNGLTILGPNAGLNDAKGTRATEAIVVAAANAPVFTIEANVTSYTIDGFNIVGADYNSGTNGQLIWSKGTTTQSNILNNKLELTSSESATSKRYIWLGPAVSGNSGANYISGNVKYNHFKANGTGNRYNGIITLQSPLNLEISYNWFEDMRGQRNILVWHPSSTTKIIGNDLATTGFLDVVWLGGPGAQGGNAGAVIQDNKFSSDGIGVGINGMNYSPVITGNSFADVSSFAVQVQTIQGTGGTVDATCNWYGNKDLDSTVQGISNGSVNFVPFLVEDVDGSISPSWSTDTYSCTGGPVRVYSDAAETNLISVHLTIQAAINASTTLPGYFVVADAGTYEELIVVSKSLSILGPNANVAGTGTRVPEAIVQFPAGAANQSPLMFVPANVHGVTIAGFDLRCQDGTIPNRHYLIGAWSQQPVNNLTIRNNRFYSSEMAIYMLAGFGANGGNGVLIEGNYIDGGPNVNSGFNRGMYIGGTSGTIQDNVVENCNIGIQYMPYDNVGLGFIRRNTVSATLSSLYHNYQTKGAGLVTWEDNVATVAQNPRITGSLATQVFGAWDQTQLIGHRAIHVLTFGTQGTGNNPSVIFRNNSIDVANPNTAIVGNTNPSDVFRAAWLTFASAGTVTLEDNSFINYTLGFVRGEDAPTTTVNATCNWWGSSDAATVTTAASTANSFFPFLTNGTDDDLSAIGFQPVPGSCDGFPPVRVYTNLAQDTLVSAHLTIQAAIDAATTLSGYVVRVDEGTYEENATTSTGGAAGNTGNTGKALSFVGSTDVNGAPTSIIKGSLYLNDNDAQSITNMKFLWNGVNNNHLLVLKNTNGLTVANCVFNGDNANQGTGQVVNGLNSVSGPNGNSDITIDSCSFVDGIFVAVSSRFQNLVVRNSVFNNIKSGINHLGTDGVLVENSVFNLNGNSSYGVRFASDASNNLTIRNSIFDIPAGTNVAIWMRANAGGTMLIENNSILAPTAILNESLNLVTATCNWFGTTDPFLVDSAISGNVTYIPYLVNGTDDDLSAPGFQPVPGSCGEFVVKVYSDAAFTALVGSHTTIQEAIDASTTLNGYFIVVPPGTYTEAVNINKQNLTLISTGGRNVTNVVNPSSLPIDDNLAGIRIQGNMGTVTVEGFTVSGFAQGILQGLNSPGTISIVKNNKVLPLDNNGDPYLRNGIQVRGDGSQVVGNEVVGAPYNTSFSSTAIGVVNGSNVLVKDNIINGEAGIGIGVLNWNVALTENATIENNEIVGAGNGIRISGRSGQTPAKVVKNVTIIGNTIEESPSSGIRVQTVSLDGLTVSDNKIIDSPGSGINISDSSATLSGTILINENNISGNTSFAIFNGTTHPIDATCNWYGTEDGNIISNSMSGSVSFLPYLVVDNMFGSLEPSWSNNKYTCIGGRVWNQTKDLYFNDIIPAINSISTTDGDVLIALPGQYLGNLFSLGEIIVTKELDIRGANYGIDPNTGTRGDESEVIGFFQLVRNNVKIDGFTISALGSAIANDFSNLYTQFPGMTFSNITFSHNIVKEKDGTDPVIKLDKTVNAGQLSLATTDWSITNNLFNDFTGNSGNSIISLGGVSGVNISGNVMNYNATNASTSAALDGRIAISLNNASNVSIEDNIIELNADASSTIEATRDAELAKAPYAIKLIGATTDYTITGNEINNTAEAVYIEGAAAVLKDIIVQDNILTNVNYGFNLAPGTSGNVNFENVYGSGNLITPFKSAIVFAAGNGSFLDVKFVENSLLSGTGYFGIEALTSNTSTAPVISKCNWYGTAVYADVLAKNAGAVEVTQFATSSDLTNLECGIVVNVSAFLEGPFDAPSGKMKTGLNEPRIPILPIFPSLPSILESFALNQPYNLPAFGNYAGTESVSPAFLIANDSIVDWVLIETRDSSNRSVVFDRKAGFICAGGTVISSTSVPIIMETFGQGNFHMAIIHRNHGNVATQNPVPGVWDIRTSKSNVYAEPAFVGPIQTGTLPNLKSVSLNFYVMYGGDGNQSNSITSLDIDALILNASTSGYFYGDYNMDGNVTTIDGDIVITNLGTTVSFPQP